MLLIAGEIYIELSMALYYNYIVLYDFKILEKKSDIIIVADVPFSFMQIAGIIVQ